MQTQNRSNKIERLEIDEITQNTFYTFRNSISNDIETNASI